MNKLHFKLLTVIDPLILFSVHFMLVFVLYNMYCLQWLLAFQFCIVMSHCILATRAPRGMRYYVKNTYHLNNAKSVSNHVMPLAPVNGHLLVFCLLEPTV